MQGIVSWWNEHGPTKRRLIQLYSALLYNAYVKGFVSGTIYTGATKVACVPGFNCYSCPGAVGACPLGSLQAALASSGQHAGFYMFGIILLYGLIAGRTICGWICPLGMIQELLHKLPTFKIKKNRFTRALSYLKYVILAVFVVAIPLWHGLREGVAIPGFCKYICPAGTFEGAMGLLSHPVNDRFFGMLGIFFTRKFVIMLAVGIACIFVYRSFCRFLCPLGALYGMFSRLAVIGVKVDLNRCNGCGACIRNCKMDVKYVGDHECIHCAQCMAVCAKGAISLNAGNVALVAPKDGVASDTERSAAWRKKAGRVAGVVAIGVLVVALVWYNFLDPSGRKAFGEASSESVTEDVAGDDVAGAYASDAPIGYEVGQQLADFSAECLDGSTFHLADYRGKVVVINLWATYCGPCVKELPDFGEFYHENEDDVAMLAVHAHYVAQDVGEFVKEQGIDVPVTIDNEDEEIFGIVNGSMALPQTIVLNRKGEVVFNEVKPVSRELLDQLYDKAAADE